MTLSSLTRLLRGVRPIFRLFLCPKIILQCNFITKFTTSFFCMICLGKCNATKFEFKPKDFSRSITWSFCFSLPVRFWCHSGIVKVIESTKLLRLHLQLFQLQEHVVSLFTCNSPNKSIGNPNSLHSILLFYM